MKSPVRVVVTGAAGQIGYSLIFRIAAGDMLGPDQPVILHLLEITPALKNLHGVVMELNDCAFPLVAGIVATDDANIAFKDADYALLVGARPRGPGMERKDLLEANAAIFSVQGRYMPFVSKSWGSKPIARKCPNMIEKAGRSTTSMGMMWCRWTPSTPHFIPISRNDGIAASLLPN